MRIVYWSSVVCSSALPSRLQPVPRGVEEGSGRHGCDRIGGDQRRHPAKAIGPHLGAGPSRYDFDIVEALAAFHDVLENALIANHRHIEGKLAFGRIEFAQVIANHRHGVAVRERIIPKQSMHLGKVEMEQRSEEHTSELQSLMRTSYAVFCLTKQQTDKKNITQYPI